MYITDGFTRARVRTFRSCESEKVDASDIKLTAPRIAAITVIATQWRPFKLLGLNQFPLLMRKELKAT